MIYALLYRDHEECDVVFFVRRTMYRVRQDRKSSFNSGGNLAEDRGPKTGLLGTEIWSRNWRFLTFREEEKLLEYVRLYG